MAVDFNKFDQMINKEQLKKDMDNAPEVEYDEVQSGTYIVSIENMEIKPTKQGDKVMLSVACKIKETIDASKKQDGRWIFFNRVIFGNRTTEKWNDGRAIKGVLTWIKDLTDEELEFRSYSQLSDDVLDLFQDIKDAIEVKVDYDPDAFNPISIKEVFDI